MGGHYTDRSMKAERRHELQTNALALWIRWRLPQLWQQYGTRILLGLIVILAIVWVVRWRLEAPNKARAAAQQQLDNARLLIGALDQNREHAESEKVPDLVRSALDQASDPDIQAQGYVLLGDYFYKQAEHRYIPATNPSAPSEPPGADLYAKAKEAYQKAIKTNATQHDLIATAHMGLAVIALTEAQYDDGRLANKALAGESQFWKEAASQFTAVADNPSAPPAIKLIAQSRLKALPEQKRPVAPPKTETLADLLPSISQNMLESTSQPSSRPALLPSTAPLGPELPATPTTRLSLPTLRPSASPTTSPATSPAH